MASHSRRNILALTLVVSSIATFTTKAQSPIVRASCTLVRDTIIRQRTPTSSYDAHLKGWAHSAVEDIPGMWTEGLLQFDLSTCLPANARVSEASLILDVANGSPNPFDVYEVLRPFTVAATWNAYASGANWTQPGAMGQGTDYGARLGGISSASLGSRAIPLSTTVVQRWVGAARVSLVVRPTGTPGTNNGPAGLGFRSKEATTGRPPVFEVAYSLPVPSSSTFKVVAWNLHYGKGMITKASGLTCPRPGMKDNAQCQIADNPATPVDERAEERRRSAWGVGLTQRYLENMVLNDAEVIALLLTEVNRGTCMTEIDLLNVVRPFWPNAEISRSHRDNWIVARWGFNRTGVNYAEADLPPCGFQEQRTDGTFIPWPSSYREGIQWARIHGADPDPDGDGVLTPVRLVNVFNAHWPHRGLRSDATPFFCMTNATITRDFMNSPAPGINLANEPKILGGDLNTEDVIRATDNVCEPIGGRAGYDALRQAGLADAYVAAGTDRSTPTTDGASGMIGKATTEVCYRQFSHNGLFMPYKRIDFQWFKGGTAAGSNLRVANFELIGVEEFGNCVPSDHMGTKVQYEWR